MIYNEKIPSRFCWGSLLFPFIFPSGGKTAPDVSFGFVLFQDLSDFFVQQGICFLKPVLQIFVDSGFGDAEVICGGAHRGAGFDDVHSQFAGSLVNVVVHVAPSDAVCY